MHQMKDSKVEWIEKIPAEWKISRLKALFSFGKGLPITKDDLTGSGVAVISYGQIHSKSNNGISIQNELIRFVSENYLQTNLDSLVNRADFIFADTSEDIEGCGNCVYIDRNMLLFAGYHTIILKSKVDHENKYLAYLFKTDAWRSQIRSAVFGVKVFSITKKILNNTTVILPDVIEQRKITAFLDAECWRIDAVIEQTRASIEEYKKLKQSVITEAVTKGIRKKRQMKDSGIEWIGEIPEKWDVSRVKDLFSFGKGLPITKDDLTESGVAVISYGQIHSKSNTGVCVQNDLIRYVPYSFIETNPDSLVKKADFIFADTSEDREGCGNCVYVDCDMELFAGYHTITFQSKSNIDNKYLAYLFKTDAWRSQIRSKVFGVKVFSISRRILNDVSVILPSENERLEIVNYLDQKCAEIDDLIKRKEQLITELETYKKSLIFEYVTGKKEIPV